MKIFNVLSILILQKVLVSGQTSINQPVLPLEGCVEVANETRVTFPGWPFHLDCSRMEDRTTEDSSQCYVLHNNSLIEPSNQQFRLNTSKSFHVYLNHSNDGRCWSKQITIQLRSLVNGSTLDGVISDYESNRSVIHVRTRHGDPNFLLDCLPPSSIVGERSYFLALPPTYNATWWRAQRYPNGTVSRFKEFAVNRPIFRNYTAFSLQLSDAQVISNPPSPHSIEKTNVNYFDPALYSCELQYQQETALIVHESICVATPVEDSSPPSVFCTDNITFVIGDDVIVECNAFSSNVMIKSGQLVVEWRRGSSSSPDCRYQYETNDAANPSDERYSCPVENFSNIAPRCFEYVPTTHEVEQHPDRKNFEISFHIRDAQRNDEGKYFVRVKYLNRTSSETQFTLEFNRQDELRQIVIILVSILVVLIFISLAVMVVWCYWIQIQLFIRRHLGKYDEDGKEFVAILSYVYSDDLSEVTRERTRKIVQCIQEKMKDMNYTFYDSHRYFDQGSTVENLLKYLNESHRMIVILTDAYVDERWTRFEAQQGFLNMLKNRTKLIFIRTPGARKALRKCRRKGDDFSSELDEAMKASRNIRWTEKMSESRFKDHVQYALPNLKRLQSHSTSSGQFVKFENFDRSDSQFTHVSVLSGNSERTSDGDEEMTFRESLSYIV